MRLPFLPSFLFATAFCLAFVYPQKSALADDFVWQAHNYEGAGSGEPPSASLIFGVPETDHARFHAQCHAGTSNRLIRAVLDYNTGTLSGRSAVNFEVSTARFSRNYKGHATGSNFEEGVAGVALLLEPGDPFWKALASGSILRYGLQGQSKIAMGLSGSGEAVRKFIRHCRTLFAASRQPGTPMKASCKNFNQLSSKHSKTPVTVTFVNKSDGHRAVLWIDFKGQPIDYAALGQGQSWTVKTYLTHPWMITDGPGNCLEMYMPQAGVNRFEITAPNKYFGPE